MPFDAHRVQCGVGWSPPAVGEYRYPARRRSIRCPHVLGGGAQHLTIGQPDNDSSREPSGRRLRPTTMLYDIIAIIALVASGVY